MPFGTKAPPVIELQLVELVEPGTCTPCWYSKIGSTMPGGVGLHGPEVLFVWAPSPTSLTKKRVLAGFGSNARRNGLRCPQEKVSWHLLPAVVPPVTLQRAVPAPWNGLPAGIPPSLVIRSTLPVSVCWSREASLLPWQPLSPA